MASAKHRARFCTWQFSHILHTSLLPEAIGGLCNLSPASSSIDPWDIILGQFRKLFMTAKMPDCITYIHLRVSRAAFENCVWSGRNGASLPDLPFTGYIQAKDAIDQSRLSSWLDVQWNPVGAKLIAHAPYRDDFLANSEDATAAAFVYFPVHGVAALAKGGRRPKGLPATPTVNRCSTSVRNHSSAYACFCLITY